MRFMETSSGFHTAGDPDGLARSQAELIAQEVESDFVRGRVDDVARIGISAFPGRHLLRNVAEREA